MTSPKADPFAALEYPPKPPTMVRCHAAETVYERMRGMEFRDMRAARDELRRVMALSHIERADLNELWRELFGAQWPSETPTPGPVTTINI